MVRRKMGAGVLMVALGSVLGCGDPSIGPGWHYVGRAGGGAQMDVWVDERSIQQSGPYLEVTERARYEGSAADPMVRALEIRALYDCAERRIALKSMGYFADKQWATAPTVTTVEDGQESWSPADGVNTMSGMKLDHVCGKAGR
jgi:hypothetical protein